MEKHWPTASCYWVLIFVCDSIWREKMKTKTYSLKFITKLWISTLVTYGSFLQISSPAIFLLTISAAVKYFPLADGHLGSGRGCCWSVSEGTREEQWGHSTLGNSPKGILDTWLSCPDMWDLVIGLLEVVKLQVWFEGQLVLPWAALDCVSCKRYTAVLLFSI